MKMKQRFIRQHRIGDRVYYPGEPADFLTKKDAKKLIKEGIVAELAAVEEEEPEVEDEQ